jgi:hypothetical protein
VGLSVTVRVGVGITVGIGVSVGVGVTVGVGVGVTVGVGVGVTVGVGVGFKVEVAVGVGVGDAVAGADVDGATVETGDVLGVDVVGATVAGEVTCVEFAPVVWGVQPDTAIMPAASRPASNATVSGRAGRLRSRRPLCSPDWTGADLKAGASLADVTVLVVLSMSGRSTSVQVTGADGWRAPGSIRPCGPGLSSSNMTIPSLPERQMMQRPVSPRGCHLRWRRGRGGSSGVWGKLRGKGRSRP